MAKIRVEEPKELIIHHVYKVDIDELLRTWVAIAQGKPVFWAHGVAFLFMEIPPVVNPEIAKEYIDGKEHWHELYYAGLKEYRNSFEVNEPDFTGMKMRIVDATGMKLLNDVAKWLKTL